MNKNKISKAADEKPLDKNRIAYPRHVAVIMDGNGRWAKRRLMPRSFGHKNGMNRMVGLMEHAFDTGVEFVTVYALSTENFRRPEEELNALYDLIRKNFLDLMRKVCARGVRLRILGDISPFPEDVRKLLRQAEEETAAHTGKGVNVALGYGSRAEIVRAVNEAVERGEKVTEESFSRLLYTRDIPDPDLLIRTGNEIRLSNYLLYQSAYTELYFSEKMFPDFSDDDLDEAFAEYSRRVRRFGKTDEQLK